MAIKGGMRVVEVLKIRLMSLYKNKPFIFITRLYYAENSVNEIIKLQRPVCIMYLRTTMKRESFGLTSTLKNIMRSLALRKVRQEEVEYLSCSWGAKVLFSLSP